VTAIGPLHDGTHAITFRCAACGDHLEDIIFAEGAYKVDEFNYVPDTVDYSITQHTAEGTASIYFADRDCNPDLRVVLSVDQLERLIATAQVSLETVRPGDLASLLARAQGNVDRALQQMDAILLQINDGAHERNKVEQVLRWRALVEGLRDGLILAQANQRIADEGTGEGSPDE
jgi:hypothetical protein